MKSIDGTQSPSLETDSRGVTEVLGVVLLIAIVLTGAGVVVLDGSGAIDRSHAQIEINQAQHAMTQFDSQASRVALQGSDRQQVDMGLRGNSGSLDVDPDDGRIQVVKVDASTGEEIDVTNESLGAMVYEHGETTIAYQGGGVWRTDGDGSVMLSRPEFHYRNDTLSMPIITIDRGEPVHSEVQIARAGPGTDRFPNESANLTNVLDDSEIIISIESEYYDAWGDYFERETNGIVHLDHDAKTATVTFLARPTTFSPKSGIISTAGHGNVSLHGHGAYISGYNSSDGTTDTRDGSIEAVGDVRLWGASEIAGDVRSGSEFEIASGAAVVDGDVYWTERFENQGTVTGTDEQISGVTSIPPITDYVIDTVDHLRTDNDNANAPGTIDGDDQLRDDPDSLEAGRYYLETMHLDSSEELVLDTTAGDITIGVQDWIGLDHGASITVVGDGEVHVYVEGRDDVFNDEITGAGEHVPATEWNLYLDKGATVTVPDHNASQLRIYGTEEFTAGFGGPQGTEFNGMVYAPSGYDGSGYTYVMHADIRGAVVTGDVTLNQYGSIYFDHALETESLPYAPTISRLDYLYVSTHGVEISGT